MRRAKSVFGGAQDAVGKVTVSFKLQDGIHHVLEDFGSSNGPVFGDVADQKHRRAGFLGKLHQLCGTFPYLGNRAGCRFYKLAVEGLDGVDDQKIRIEGLDLLKNLLGIRFG